MLNLPYCSIVWYTIVTKLLLIILQNHRTTDNKCLRITLAHTYLSQSVSSCAVTHVVNLFCAHKLTVRVDVSEINLYIKYCVVFNNKDGK